jgi:arabinose-5-phosphate isomerase
VKRTNEIKALLKAEADAILGIQVDGSFEKAIELMHTSRSRNGKVVLSGMGKAGEVAGNVATTLSSTGTPAVFLHAGDAQHGDIGVIQPHDVLFLFSNSGKTREVLELIKLTRRLYPGLPMVAVTGNPRAQLAKLANVTIFTGAPEEICPIGLTPTTSTTVMTVIGDVLVVMMMRKIGFSKADYAKRHHGGYLGRKARSGTTSQ